MRRLFVLITVAVLGFRGTARADLTSQLYGDVHDVIEELIQTEVTTSVVATIRVRSPGLAFYMHSTLERLGSPYWGSLGRVLKDDVTVATADFVYWHASRGVGTGDVVASAREFFNCARQTSADEACKRLTDAIVTQHRSLLEVECRRSTPAAARRIACDLGLATLAALKGRAEARHHIVDALSDIVLLEVGDTDLGNRMRDVLALWLELPKDLPTPLLEALANPDLGPELTDEALEKRCGTWSEMRKALDDPSEPFGWLCFAITHRELIPQLAATVVVRENGKSFLQKVDHWVIAAALKEYDSDRADDDSVYRMFADLAFDAQCPAPAPAKDGAPEPPEPAEQAWPCGGKRLDVGAEVSVYWLRRPPYFVKLNAQGRFVGPPAKPLNAMVQSVEKFRRLVRRVQELRTAVPPSLEKYVFHAGRTVQADTTSALRALHRMARLVSELRGRWYLWSQTQAHSAFEELDVVELLEAARNSLDEATIQGNASLAFLDRTAKGAATLDIGDWLRLVMRNDFRALAMESLRAALDIRLDQKDRPKETFFLSLAAYLLDNSEGVGEQVARSAFRASAKELLLSMSHRGVPRVGDRARFNFAPRLLAGLSFADSYAATDGDSRRRVVAAEWPTAMLALNDYVGVEASALDLIAPLTELALRPPGSYSKQTNVLLDFIRPRAGIWVAVPQLSRRVALTTGVAARFLDVKRTDDASTGTVHAEYGRKASLLFDAGVQFVF